MTEVLKEVRPLRLKAQDNLRELMNNYWQQAKRAKEEGKLISWCTAISPADILAAAGIFNVFPENHCAACGAAKVGGELCQVAESYGYSVDLCSYVRCDIGSSLSGAATKSPYGGLPKPDVVLACNNQCDTVDQWNEELSRMFHVPVILVDVPFWHDWYTEGDVREALEYVRHQLEEMVSQVEDITHRHFDYERLRECLGYTRRLGTLWREVQYICRSIPSPVTSFDHFIWLFAIVVLRGRPEGIPVYEALKAEVEERVAHKIGAIPEEKYRLYWDNIAVWYRLREMSSKFASYGAIPIAAEYPLVWVPFEKSDPAHPLQSMAETVFSAYVNQGIKRRTQAILRLVEEFSLDGLVMQTTRCCRQFFMGQYDIAWEVQERLGVPSLFIEGDMVDSRAWSDAEINARIDDFMGILTSKPARRK